jgi:hypothetical protein
MAMPVNGSTHGGNQLTPPALGALFEPNTKPKFVAAARR